MVEYKESLPVMNFFRHKNALRFEPSFMRYLSQDDVVKHTDVVNVISAIFAAIFILCLPARIWQLRASRAKNFLRWQGRSKAVSTPILSIN